MGETKLLRNDVKVGTSQLISNQANGFDGTLGGRDKLRSFEAARQDVLVDASLSSVKHNDTARMQVPLAWTSKLIVSERADLNEKDCPRTLFSQARPFATKAGIEKEMGSPTASSAFNLDSELSDE